jgi:hypothetical protein
MKKKLIRTLVGAAVLSLVLMAAGSEAGAGQTTVTVQANRLLNDTKLFVQAGDVVSFEAKGKWTVKPKEGIYCGPEGEPGTSAPAGYQMPGAPIGSLVAIVMGNRYLVGSGGEVVFDKSGPVQLTANTVGKFSAYPANKGALTVLVELKKKAAAGVNGRYQVTFKEDQVVIAAGGSKKVISLEELQKETVKHQTGGPIQLPADTAEQLKALSRVIDLEVDKARVIVRDPENPKEPPKKGLYDPNKREFLLHLEGSLKQVVGTCYFTHVKNITAKFGSGQNAPDLEGNINLTLSIFCGGSQGQKGKGTGVIVSVPFVGKRIPQ